MVRQDPADAIGQKSIGVEERNMNKNTYNRAKEIQEALMNIQDIEDAFKKPGILRNKVGMSTYFSVDSCTEHFEPFSIPIVDSLTPAILESIRKAKKSLEEEFKRL